MKIYICLLIVVMVCSMVRGSHGWNCTDGLVEGNTTTCIYCRWREKLKGYLNESFGILEPDHNFNVTVCVNASGNNAGSGGNIMIFIMFYGTGETSTEKENMTCQSNVVEPTNQTEDPFTPTDVITAGETAGRLESEAENLKEAGIVETAKKQTLVVYDEPDASGNIGSATEPIFESTDSGTKVEKLQIRGNVTGQVRIVVIKSTETITVNPEAKVESILEGSSSEAVTQANIFGGEFLLLDAFTTSSENNKLDISLSVFSLTIGQTINEALVEDAINKAQRDANTGSFGRSFLTQPAYTCTFVDANNSLSNYGCESIPDLTTGVLSCRCNHATVFAALVSARVVTIPSGVKILSYVLEIISIIFLLVTSIVLMKVRNRVRGDRVKVQISLSLSLLALHVVSVLHDAALLNNTLCEIWAVLTQFFLLSSAMWMLMEGLTLSFKTMDSVMRLLSGANARKFAIFRYVFSYSVPCVIVLITASIGFSSNPATYMPVDPVNNGKYQHCWLGEQMLLGGAVIPVAVIVSCCIVIAVRMCYVVYRMSSESDNYKPTDQSTGKVEIMNLQHIKASLKATLVLLPVLGIPWFLGFFTAVENGGVQMTFMYLNTIFNGLQGVMLFFVYCVLGKEVRHSAMKILIRKGLLLGSGSTTDRTITSASHGGTYTTKLQETSNGRHGSSSVHDDEKTANDKL